MTRTPVYAREAEQTSTSGQTYITVIVAADCIDRYSKRWRKVCQACRRHKILWRNNTRPVPHGALFLLEGRRQNVIHECYTRSRRSAEINKGQTWHVQRNFDWGQKQTKKYSYDSVWQGSALDLRKALRNAKTTGVRTIVLSESSIG